MVGDFIRRLRDKIIRCRGADDNFPYDHSMQRQTLLAVSNNIFSIVKLSYVLTSVRFQSTKMSAYSVLPVYNLHLLAQQDPFPDASSDPLLPATDLQALRRRRKEMERIKVLALLGEAIPCQNKLVAAGLQLLHHET